MDFQSFKLLLYNQKVDKYQLFGQLKLQVDFNRFDRIIKASIGHPITKRLILANPFPKKIEELKSSKIVPYSGSLAGEISWVLYSIANFTKEINEFIELKKEYDKFILLGKINDAESILNQIEKKFGYSFWLIENRILVEEISGGTEANWSKLSELSKIVTDPYVRFFIENFSKRAESKISYSRYKNLFINQVNDIGGFEGFGEYLCFRLNYSSFTGYSNFAYYLNIESIAPVVDRYLLLRDVLTELFTNKQPETSAVIQKSLERLNEIGIKDSWLSQLSFLNDPNKFVAFDSSKELFDLLEAYTMGGYEKSCELAKQLITKNPLVVEAYEIYCKSLIENKKEFHKIGISTIIDQILEELYDILSKNSKLNTSQEQLLKSIVSFHSTTWAKQLFSIISATSKVNDNRLPIRLFKIAYSEINNPGCLNYFINKDGKFRIAYDNYKQLAPENVGVDLNYAIEKGDIELILSKIPDSNKRKIFYNGKSLFRQKKYQNATELFSKLILEDISHLTLEESLFYLIVSQIHLKHHRSALVTFVDYYLKNKNYVGRIPHLRLINDIEKESYKGVDDLIELPILIKIGKTDPYEQYIAYDVFMTSHSYSRPSEMLPDIAKFDKEKMTFFLYEICNPEILHHSFHFEGTEDIENERSLVLHELLKLDRDNESIYIKELTEIQQNIKVRNALREVNKGRITVNVPELKNSELASIKEGFNRYVILNNFAKNKELVSVDTTNPAALLEYLNNITEELKNKVVYVNDSAFISFKVLFLDLRDKYLLSKEYGLDGYLSTRIRHGSLLNHIRSVFEKFDLVSQKDANGDYLESRYWNEHVSFQMAGKLDLIQKEIKRFSKIVDDYTEYIIKELVQVKTEKYSKKVNALFDYSLDQNALAYLFSETRDKILDHRIFLDFVFNYLVEHTNILLTSIREKINNEIKTKYLTFLSDFQDSIKTITGDSAMPNLTSSIVKCSTQIQTELNNISEWFSLSNPSSDLIFDIETIVQTSVEICNSINPIYKINPKITLESEIPVYGGIHLIYITKILLDNIVEHSEVNANEQEVLISCKHNKEETITITVSNLLPPSMDKEALSQKFAETKNKWNRDRNNFENINIEGGSGFDKIRKILALDMSNKLYDFDFKIEENTLMISIQFSVKIKEVDEEL